MLEIYWHSRRACKSCVTVFCIFCLHMRQPDPRLQGAMGSHGQFELVNDLDCPQLIITRTQTVLAGMVSMVNYNGPVRHWFKRCYLGEQSPVFVKSIIGVSQYRRNGDYTREGKVGRVASTTIQSQSDTGESRRRTTAYRGKPGERSISRPTSCFRACRGVRQTLAKVDGFLSHNPFSSFFQLLCESIYAQGWSAMCSVQSYRHLIWVFRGSSWLRHVESYPQISWVSEDSCTLDLKHTSPVQSNF